MILKKGNIFDDFEELDFVGITTNSILTKGGALVMGAGVAKTAKEYCSSLPVLFGSQIKAKEIEGGFYGLLVQGKYFAFQTKRHWKYNSSLSDVIQSINMLKRVSTKYSSKKFGLPFPAINNGGLNWMDIIVQLEELPDNVTVYHLEDLK
ncbi:MAG: hypothetical protein KBT03_13070 [Bacteroidales bacterium]|nr:hypothetical protein [Candidatus Scybalousia scybalohippi]